MIEQQRDALIDAYYTLVERFRALQADLAAAREREQRLTAALPDPGKLWALAAWIDSMYPNESNPEVQRDLRAWSRTIYALDPEKYGKSVVPAIIAAAAPSAVAQKPRGEGV